MRSLIFALFAILTLASCGQKNDYLAERKAAYAAWKLDLNQLALESKEPVLEGVKNYLDRGVAFATPEPDGGVMVQEADGTPVVTILVLFPRDAEISQKWHDLYHDRKRNGAASYIADGNFMILRHEPTSSKVRGLLLGHEGFHAATARANDFAEQDRSEFCGEESVAHRLEIEVMKRVAPKTTALVQQEASKVTASLQATKGDSYTATFHLSNETWDAEFGPAQSKIDEAYRATLLATGAMYYGFLAYYHNDDEAMDRLAGFLCKQYERLGIR